MALQGFFPSLSLSLLREKQSMTAMARPSHYPAKTSHTVATGDGNSEDSNYGVNPLLAHSLPRFLWIQREPDELVQATIDLSVHRKEVNEFEILRFISVDDANYTGNE